MDIMVHQTSSEGGTSMSWSWSAPLAVAMMNFSGGMRVMS